MSQAVAINRNEIRRYRARLAGRALGVSQIVFVVLVVLIVVVATTGLAADEQTAGEERTNKARVTKGSDPSEIVSRLEVRNEYVDLDGEGFANTTFLRGDWAAGEHWQLRLDIPLTGSDSEGPGSSYGLGDLYVSARGRWEFLEQWALVGELGFKLDTASDDALGSGKNQIAPFGALVWKPSPAWILAPIAYQYSGSFTGDEHREDIRESDLSPRALAHLPMGFWLLVETHLFIDHERDDDVAFYPEGEFGRVVTEHVEVWVRGGGKVAGSGTAENSGWKAELGVRYLFD